MGHGAHGNQYRRLTLRTVEHSSYGIFAIISRAISVSRQRAAKRVLMGRGRKAEVHRSKPLTPTSPARSIFFRSPPSPITSPMILHCPFLAYFSRPAPQVLCNHRVSCEACAVGLPIFPTCAPVLADAKIRSTAVLGPHTNHPEGDTIDATCSSIL